VRVLQVWRGAQTRVERLKGVAFGSAEALLTNIKVGRKGLSGTNTQADSDANIHELRM
jgi:hypothetical protein